MRRFLCEKENITGNTVSFDREQSNHISRVLRLNVGDGVIASLGDGFDMLCRLNSVGSVCQAEILDKYVNPNETKCELCLFQAVIKNEKMDFVIQKATELGVKRIVPVMAERTVIKLEDAKREERKHERWQKIAFEACKQCERGSVPKVEKAMSFDEAMKEFSKYSLKLAAFEDEEQTGICQKVKKADSCAYFIGPEGGITPKELEKLKNAGAESVSLGKRILRAETAAVACGAVILALMGEMDV